MTSLTDWVAEKLTTDQFKTKVLRRTPEGFLVVGTPSGYTFTIAVIGVKRVVELSDVQPLFVSSNKPQLVINVPSNTLWRGAAINFVHSVPAAFGIMGDIERAAHTSRAETFRDKNMGFFINAITQHKNVSGCSYVYDRVFQADRWDGTSLTIAVIDAYNMSAEDVRNARTRIGNFNVIVKSSSHGCITPQAEQAAISMGAEALTFGELMVRLSK